MNPSMVNKIFSQKPPRIPTVKNTPKGGAMIARMMRIKLIARFLNYNYKGKYMNRPKKIQFIRWPRVFRTFYFGLQLERRKISFSDESHNLDAGWPQV